MSVSWQMTPTSFSRQILPAHNPRMYGRYVGHPTMHSTSFNVNVTRISVPWTGNFIVDTLAQQV